MSIGEPQHLNYVLADLSPARLSLHSAYASGRDYRKRFVERRCSEPVQGRRAGSDQILKAEEESQPAIVYANLGRRRV